jgi:hypothetical protein
MQQVQDFFGNTARAFSAILVLINEICTQKICKIRNILFLPRSGIAATHCGGQQRPPANLPLFH